MTSHDNGAAGATTAALPLAPGRWTVDAAHSSVTFAIRHLGLAKVRGRFARVGATLDVGTSPGDVTVAATVELDSIDTGNTDRDAHVKAPEFLDTARRPTMSFVSDTVTGAGDAWRMEGTLTIGDVARRMAFDVSFNGISDALGPTSAGFEASGQVSRKDFGLSFEGTADAAIGDTVKFELDLEFHAPAPAPVA